MRKTSLRRAPQRLIIDRTLGDTGRPLLPGACSACFRVIAIRPSGRRAWHNDATGQRCTGSGVRVVHREIHLDEIPPIVVPPKKEGNKARGAFTVDGEEYRGTSYRNVANGRTTCPDCERQLPLNLDGTIRRHRVRHQDPLSPYCPGGAA